VVEHGLTRAIISTVVNAIFNGDGTGGTLLGLFNRPGVQTQASSSADYATALALIKKVESASAVLSPTTAGFVMGSDTAGLYRAEEMAAGSGMAMMGYTLAGFPAVVTEQTAQASLCFGDWSQLLILSYGRLQLGVDPFGASNTTQFRAGQVTLRALWDVDMIPMRPDAFCTASGLS
jgi:HK97 family phage major capsid protein